MCRFGMVVVPNLSLSVVAKGVIITGLLVLVFVVKTNAAALMQVDMELV
jgi:hypothetical protein